MKKIRIGHDNSGLGPAWHLNRVEVTNLKTGEHRIFPANKWFSKTDDDYQVRMGRGRERRRGGEGGCVHRAL